MGNTPGKSHSRERKKKYLLLKGAERPSPPGKPYLVAVDDGTPDVLTISWAPSANTGGTTLTGYLVEHRRTGSPHWVKASPTKVTTCELTLSGLEPGWRYQFRTFAENLVGLSDASELSDPLTVTHQRSAIVAPKFSKELLDTVAIENSKVEFVCYFVGQPTPKICWFKDGFEIFSSRRTRILTENDRSILTIHQSALSDEGEIKCTATNKAGHVSTRARLTLEAPPSIRLPRQYEDGLLFEIGEILRLKVSVAGLPRPLVFWSHNGEPINERERYEIENDVNSSTLKINEALRGDRGEYQIRAVNKLGSDVASFLVTVTDKPSPPGSAKVVMSLGRSVTLSWNTPQDDGGCKIGNYIVEYYRLGWNVWLKAATTKQLSTILGDLIEGSEYKFRVKAESPFGVSEPSLETDLVFIPDPKRGMLEPAGGRGRSQPRDIIDDLVPVAAKRTKGRSQSSSRAGEEDDYNFGSPPRPRRNKVTSPPKTPEFSPKSERKASTLNRTIFDRESMYQDLSYGSPDLKISRSDAPVPVIAEVKPMQQATTLPTLQLKTSLASGKAVSSQRSTPTSDTLKERSPSPSHYVQKGDTHKFVKDQPVNQRKPLSRDNSENLGGSTEFMMVLYPEEVKESSGTSMHPFEDMGSVPPPLSLSAPELGSEPPQLFDPIKYSASSTELLHERAMVRFYNEALAEEEAIQRKMGKQGVDIRKASLIPKIQINNPDEQDITNLERKHSLRRRLSAGGTIPHNILNTQKRHSLRKSGDLSDLFGSGILNKSLNVDERRNLMQNRQRSTSEEREEEEFERIRSKMAEHKPAVPKKKISVVKEDVWEDEEYTKSLSEEELSEDESVRGEIKIREISPDEEDETYHPKMAMRTKFEAPFEILTKPAKLPEPNFVPKPILKKKDGEVSPPTSGSEVDAPRSRSNSLIEDYLDIQRPKVHVKEDTSVDRNLSAIAGAGLTAAGIIISQPILHKKEAEEAKSVIEHYGEIVRTQAQKTLRGVEDNPLRAALKKQALLQARLHYSDEEEEEQAPPPPTKVFDPPIIAASLSKAKTSGDRPKPIERKIEAPPKSATSPIKSIRDDIYPKLPQMLPKSNDQSKVAEVSTKPIERMQKRKEEESPQPRTRGREETRFGKRSVATSKSPYRNETKIGVLSKSPLPEQVSRETSNTRSTSKTPSRSTSQARPPSRTTSQTRPQSRSASKSRPDKRSSSPTATYLRKPKMCEIMTQTSTCVDPDEAPFARRVLPSDDKLKAIAQVKVRNTMDYITDLAMFAVVFWVFLFSNELLAIPFLLVAVYRQLQDELKRWIPNWIRKRWNKGKNE